MYSQVQAQDTVLLKQQPHIKLLNAKGLYAPDLILGNEHQFRGNLAISEDSSEVTCYQCVYFFQTGDIAIELAEVDVTIESNSRIAKIIFHKSFTETLIIPNKLKVQILEMNFDVTKDQPALMSPKVTEEFMAFERSQLVYYNSYNDSTSFLSNKVKVDLKTGDVILEGVEVFKPYGAEIIPNNYNLKLDRKGNFYPLKDARIVFKRYGDTHDIEGAKIKFKKQSTWYKAKGLMEAGGKMHQIKAIEPEMVGGVYQVGGKVKK